MSEIVNISLKARDMYAGSQGLIEAAAGLEVEIESLQEEERLLRIQLIKLRQKISEKESQRISCLETANLILNKTEQATKIAHYCCQ